MGFLPMYRPYIDRADEKLSESFIKEIHRILKTGTSDSRKSWFNVGDYKKFPNEVGGNVTCSPEDVRVINFSPLDIFDQPISNGYNL